MHRPVLLAILALAVVLAGCADGPSPGTSSPQTSTSAPLPPPPAMLAAPKTMPSVMLGPGAGEPNIAVAPDGTVYVTPIDHVYRSSDGGKSFTDLGTTKTDGHGDGDIAVDSTGRVHWLGLFGKAGAIPYQSSTDQGQTWSKAIDLSSPTFKTTDGTGSDREWIDTTPDGWVYTAWRDSAQSGTIAFRASPDLGATWLKLVTISPDHLTGPLVHGPVAGTAYIPFTVYDGAGDAPVVGSVANNFHFEIAATADHGATWSVHPVLRPDQAAAMGPVDEGSAIFPVAAVDDGGTVYMAWAVPQPTQGVQAPRTVSRFGVYLTHSGDNGVTWSDPILVSDPAHVSLEPFLAAGAPGHLALVWYENTLGNPSDNVPDLWNVKLWESGDADLGAAAHHQLVQLNGQPNHIGSVCTVGGGCLAGGDRSLLDYFEVAIQPNGQPIATWSSSVGGTAVGIAAQGTDIWVGGIADGTPLRTPSNVKPA
jgi:hypothetical protein